MTTTMTHPHPHEPFEVSTLLYIELLHVLDDLLFLPDDFFVDEAALKIAPNGSATFRLPVTPL